MKKAAFLIAMNEDKKILLVQSLSRKEFLGQWSLPGGILESDESHEDCAKRECLEETGIMCEILGMNMSYDDEEYQVSITIFNARQVGGVLKLQHQEIQGAKWFSIKEALELTLAYNTREVIHNLLSNTY